MKDGDEAFRNGKERPIKGGYTHIEDKSLWLKVKFENKWLQWLELSLNPIVTLLSLIIVIAFIIWAILIPEVANTEIGSWKSWIGHNFTWLYIGSQDVWAIFILIIFFSKYSSLKLGPDTSEPEYNDASWFSMLFACGVSTGLFFFGVAEPVLHYTATGGSRNRYTADPFTPDNTLAQEAMNVTLYHWGLHGWVVYTIVGLLLALMAHREGLPMTLKSCFYPLIGEKIFGWPGDLIDILSVIATLFGVCTSLGLGTIQINEGLNLINPGIEISTTTQVIIIWTITSVATISVLSGVKYGIRRISEFCFGCGLVLMLLVLFLDKTVFLLNLYTQSMGYYLNWLIQIGFHSDAFEQLGPSAGQEDRGRFVPEGVDTTDGASQWMEWWTIFYWGWWIAWCPFVGMFIAKISYGRTIKEFIAGTMAAPSVYVFMWLVIFGGAGLRMEREAAMHDLCCHNVNTSHLMHLAENSPDSALAFSNSLCVDDGCNPCSQNILETKISEGNTFNSIGLEIKEIGEKYWGITVPSRQYTRLSCRSTEQMWFDLMLSYGDLGQFLSIFSLVSLVLYFVTSSDSGSLVIDCLASNGNPHPPALQRLCWALLEGLCATALLVAGGNKSLQALQAVAIASGLVYTILMCIACVALWRALKIAAGDTCENEPAFSIDVLDPLLADPIKELFSSDFSERTWKKITLFVKFLVNIFSAPYSMAKTYRLLHGSAYFLPIIIVGYTLLSLSVIFQILQIVISGAWALGLVLYVVFAFMMGVVRSGARDKLGIPGSPLEDFCVSLLLYPSVALQMVTTMENTRNVTPMKLEMKERRGRLNTALSTSDDADLTLSKDDLKEKPLKMDIPASTTYTEE